MTVPLPSHEHPAAPVRAAWRVAVLTQADRLERRLRRTDPVRTTDRDEVGLLLQRARLAATTTPKLRTLCADWWSGTSVETAWAALHLAETELLRLEPPEQLRAMGPHLRSLAQTFPPDRAKVEEEALREWETQPNAAVAARILGTHQASSDQQHQRSRVTRNVVYLFITMISALVLVLWWAGVTSGAIVGLGALAGALSVVLALRGDTSSGPYNLLPAQSLLKVPAGAGTALLSVKILNEISGAPQTSQRDALYAAVFGFSQQAFTRLVDQRATALSKGPDARTGSAKPSAPS